MGRLEASSECMISMVLGVCPRISCRLSRSCSHGFTGSAAKFAMPGDYPPQYSVSPHRTCIGAWKTDAPAHPLFYTPVIGCVCKWMPIGIVLLLITRIPAPTLGPVVLHSLIVVVLVFVSLFYFVPLAVHAVAYR